MPLDPESAASGKWSGCSIAMGFGFTPAAPLIRAHLLPALTQPLAILRWQVEKALAGLDESLLLILGQCFKTTATVFDALALFGIVSTRVGAVAATMIRRSSLISAAIVIVIRQLNPAVCQRGKRT